MISKPWPRNHVYKHLVTNRLRTGILHCVEYTQ